MPDFYEATERAREAHERRLIPRVRRRFAQLGAQLTAAVRQAGSAQAAVLAAERRAQDTAPAIDMLEAIYRQAVPAFAEAARAGVRAMKQDEEEIDWQERVRRFLMTEGAEMVSAITDTTREQVRQVLLEGMREGFGVEKMARRLEEEWEDVARVRSRRIVRTEMIAASNYGSLEGAKATAEAAGLALKKEWIATPDDRTRDTHLGANGQQVAMNERFTVGGYGARYPGDPALPADERVQCRCAVAFVRANDGTRKESSKSYVDERNEAIRAAYPELRDEHNRPMALDMLSERFHLSPSYVRDIVYDKI